MRTVILRSVVYICIGILIGRVIHKKTQIKNIFLATLTSSIIFFIITNFAVWAATPLYPRTVSGFIDCYIMALPFLRNSLLGDFMYAGFFFCALEQIIFVIKQSVCKNSFKLNKQV